MPLSGARSANFFHRNDRPLPAPGEELGADYRVVGGRYFEAIGIPLIRGRVFDASDDENAPPRFIVNRALAERYFPGEDAVGKHITYEWYGPQSGEIVGVVGSVREMALDEAPSPAVYRPHAQDPSQLVTVVLRAAVEPLSLGHSAAAVVRDVDPALPPPTVRTLEELMTGTLSRQRLTMFLLVGFAAVSLLLVVIGLYGIVAYSVAQRTRELGIRMALGAQRSDVLRMVIGEGMVLGAAGVVIGLGGALALRRLPAGLLYGVTPTDPGTFVVVAIVLGATTLLASYLPASRASRINPAGVLGAEN
jgi:predicted permease